MQDWRCSISRHRFPDGHGLSIVLKEINALNIHYHHMDTPGLRCALTRGWEDFLTEQLRIRCRVGGSPFNTNPSAFVLSSTPSCAAFGASLLTPPKLIRTICGSNGMFLFRPDCLSKQSSMQWMKHFHNMLLSLQQCTQQVFVLYRRGECRAINACVDGYEGQGMSHVLCSMKHLHFRRYTPQGGRFPKALGNSVCYTVKVTGKHTVHLRTTTPCSLNHPTLACKPANSNSFGYDGTS